MKFCTTLTGFLLLMVAGVKGEGYTIDIQIKGLSDTSIYIGYHFADKKYVRIQSASIPPEKFPTAGMKIFRVGFTCLFFPA